MTFTDQNLFGFHTFYISIILFYFKTEYSNSLILNQTMIKTYLGYVSFFDCSRRATKQVDIHHIASADYAGHLLD